MCVWQDNAVSSPSIYVLKRLIFFPELYEAKGIQNVLIFMVRFIEHYIITYFVQEDLSNHIQYQTLFQVIFWQKKSKEGPKKLTKS